VNVGVLIERIKSKFGFVKGVVMDNIIQKEGYKIFNATDQMYEGEQYSFIANKENAHNKLLETTRQYCHRGNEYEVHKLIITGIETEIIERRKSKYNKDE
jgi:hypothetical protein